jgi:hypothetical protein
MERLSGEKAEEFLTAGFKQLGKKVRENEIFEAVKFFGGTMGWLTSYGYHASRTNHKKAITITVEEGVKLVRDELESFLAQRRQARIRYLSILGMIVSPMTWSEVKRGLGAKLGRAISDKQLSNYLAELVDYSFAAEVDKKYTLADPLVRQAVSKMR